jgi:threonine synthase
MSALSQSGEYTIPQDELSLLANKFSAGYCNDEESLSTIGNVFKNYKYLMDTHTAVAWNVSEKLASTANKTVILSTASPYKFSASVLKALGAPVSDNEFEMIKTLHALTGAPIPESLANLDEARSLHNDKIAKEDMESYVISCTEVTK